MIVCSCNRISDRDIDNCAVTPKNVAAAFRSLDCAPRCGRCAGAINEVLKAARARDLTPAQLARVYEIAAEFEFAPEDVTRLAAQRR